VLDLPVTDVRHDEEQKERSRPGGAREVLPAVPKAHRTQRDAV